MKGLLTALLLLSPLTAFAIINELSLDFGYDKQIYGIERQNNNVNRTYSVGISSYILNYTAIDINASRSDNITTENDVYAITNDIDIIGQQSRVQSVVFGLGVKQMFAPKTAWLVPGISLGYARQTVTYKSTISAMERTTGTLITVSGGEKKQKVDSMFGTFSLKLKLSERLGLTGSVKTLFPAFEFSDARNNIKYTAGLSWIF